MSGTDRKRFVGDLREGAGSVFLTGLAVDYYSSFWEGWMAFVGWMEG